MQRVTLTVLEVCMWRRFLLSFTPSGDLYCSIALHFKHSCNIWLKLPYSHDGSVSNSWLSLASFSSNQTVLDFLQWTGSQTWYLESPVRSRLFSRFPRLNLRSAFPCFPHKGILSEQWLECRVVSIFVTYAHVKPKAQVSAVFLIISLAWAPLSQWRASLFGYSIVPRALANQDLFWHKILVTCLFLLMHHKGEFQETGSSADAPELKARRDTETCRML